MPNATPIPTLADADAERFWSKVDRSGGPTSCWTWTASITPYGYGQFRLSPKTLRSHRVAYSLTHGQVPEGMDLDHLCRNRACVNPAHLQPVTNHENIIRGKWGEAHEANRAKTECPHGHPYEGDNVYVIASRPNARYCRACNNTRHLKYGRRR